jgi:hypothetical protein
VIRGGVEPADLSLFRLADGPRRLANGILPRSGRCGRVPYDPLTLAHTHMPDPCQNEQRLRCATVTRRSSRSLTEQASSQVESKT